MPDLLPYSVETIVDPVTKLATVVVTTYGDLSQQFQASFTSSVPGVDPVLLPSPTTIAEIASVVQTTNSIAKAKSAPSKSVTKVATPKTH